MNKLIRVFLLSLLGILNLSVYAAPITSGEKVTISIYGVPADEKQQINGDYIVSDSGMLYLPMLENGIKASGSSSSTVARRIEAAYKSAQIYTSPRITIITVRDVAESNTIAQKFVTVAGNVKRPGPVQYTEGMTIYEAVAAAGDADPFGAMNRVELLRNGKKYVYNLKTTAHRTLKVYHGDTITVPQKNFIGQ